ncbi:MAG: hypothetical protein ACT4OT_17975 [Acidobacteriota bacterium]
MSSNSDQAKRIAERVARKLASSSSSAGVERPSANSGNGLASDQPRARIIDFISSGPPIRSAPSVVQATAVADVRQDSGKSTDDFFQFIPATQSPWLGRLPAMLGQDNTQSAILNPHTVDHPSQERFGIEEATVAELVEFFEKEKKCSVDPSGKPCDHCAMCSSRGF